MRALFTWTIVFLGLWACGKNAHHGDSSAVIENLPLSTGINLIFGQPNDFRYPNYIVVDPSVFTTCHEKAICQQHQLQIIDRAIREWFGTSNHPLIEVITSENDVPTNSVNRPIRIKIGSEGCENVTVPSCNYTLWACYDRESAEITVLSVWYFRAPVLAHELGHAFGLLHVPLVNRNCSAPIMSEPLQSFTVTDLDKRLLCQQHPEWLCPIGKGNPEDDLRNTAICRKSEKPPPSSKKCKP
jgi:hypothetical protein